VRADTTRMPKYITPKASMWSTSNACEKGALPARRAAGAGAPGPDRVSATIMRVTPKAPQKRACTA
jgi:hypothetical protein